MAPTQANLSALQATQLSHARGFYNTNSSTGYIQVSKAPHMLGFEWMNRHHK